ncbi:hypothetical protein NMY22_g11668 [Coprinellus aureogranulatus]|nr:hypothetical protein NMY22_g11668 [Coprinellus aureogranulatus]
MQLTHLLSAITIAVAATQGLAADIVTYRGYASTVQCSGDNFSAVTEVLSAVASLPGWLLRSVREPPLRQSGSGLHRERLHFLPVLRFRPRPQKREVDEDCAIPNGFEYRDAAGAQHVITTPGRKCHCGGGDCQTGLKGPKEDFRVFRPSDGSPDDLALDSMIGFSLVTGYRDATGRPHDLAIHDCPSTCIVFSEMYGV